MVILGMILLAFFGWFIWQIITFMAAAAVAVVSITVMVVISLCIILTDPALAHSPAAVATILIIGGIVIAVTATIRNSGDTTPTSPRKPRGPFD